MDYLIALFSIVMEKIVYHADNFSKKFHGDWIAEF